MEKLQKAIHPKDMVALQLGHIKGGEEQVDATPHVASTSHLVPHEIYSELIDKQDAPRGVLGVQGISPKSVHKLSSGTVMLKPFHRNDNMGPATFGWASATTPHLYAAADIGHLCDKVGVIHHNNMHLTVHPFEPGAVSAHEYSTGAVTGELSHPQDFAKIAVMDFLLGNQDRHKHNLMLHPNSSGQLQPLAIDNERGMEYVASKSMALDNTDSLDPYWHGDVGHRDGYRMPHAGSLHGGKLDPKHVPGVAKWWMRVADQVKDEFNKHIGNIKDENTKNHIIRNFNARHEALTKGLRPFARGTGKGNPFQEPIIKTKMLEAQDHVPVASPTAPTLKLGNTFHEAAKAAFAPQSKVMAAQEIIKQLQAPTKKGTGNV